MVSEILRLRTEIAVISVTVVIVLAGLFLYISYGSGVLKVQVTDPPREWGQVTQIYLNLSRVEIHRTQQDNESGWITVIDKSTWINLTRTIDFNETIGLKNLQAGTYNLIRLEIPEALVTVAGANHTAVPSGKITVAITHGGVKINTGQTSAVLIELNVNVEQSGAYGFKLDAATSAASV